MFVNIILLLAKIQTLPIISVLILKQSSLNFIQRQLGPSGVGLASNADSEFTDMSNMGAFELRLVFFD